MKIILNLFIHKTHISTLYLYISLLAYFDITTMWFVYQAFSDYQLQQMTSNFIDQFGFNEEEFAEQEDKIE